jgi:hypothetical protein
MKAKQVLNQNKVGVTTNPDTSNDVSEQTLQDLPEEERDNAKQAIGVFVEYDEYVTIEIDTVKHTAEVLTVK